MSAVKPSTERGQKLGSLVNTIRAELNYTAPAGSRLSLNSFARAAAMCRNIRDVDMEVFGESPLGDRSALDAYTMSKLRTLTNVTSLRLTNWSEDHVLPHLLLAWPSVRRLSLSGLLPDASCVPEAPALDLQALHFNNIARFSPTDYITNLLAVASGPLRSLSFERCPPPKLLQHLVDTYGPSLESLSLPACAVSNQVHALESCPNLREVALRPREASDAATLLEAIPSSVCRLAVRVQDGPALSVVDQLVGRVKQLSSVMLYATGDLKMSSEELKAGFVGSAKVMLLEDAQEFRMLSKCPLYCMLFLNNEENV